MLDPKRAMYTIAPYAWKPGVQLKWLAVGADGLQFLQASWKQS